MSPSLRCHAPSAFQPRLHSLPGAAAPRATTTHDLAPLPPLQLPQTLHARHAVPCAAAGSFIDADARQAMMDEAVRDPFSAAARTGGETDPFVMAGEQLKIPKRLLEQGDRPEQVRWAAGGWDGWRLRRWGQAAKGCLCACVSGERLLAEGCTEGRGVRMAGSGPSCDMRSAAGAVPEANPSARPPAAVTDICCPLPLPPTCLLAWLRLVVAPSFGAGGVPSFQFFQRWRAGDARGPGAPQGARRGGRDAPRGRPALRHRAGAGEQCCAVPRCAVACCATRPWAWVGRALAVSFQALGRW